MEDGNASDKLTLIAIPMTEDKSSKDSVFKENYQVLDKLCNVMPNNLPKSHHVVNDIYWKERQRVHTNLRGNPSTGRKTTIVCVVIIF